MPAPPAQPFVGVSVVRWRSPGLWWCVAAHVGVAMLLAVAERIAGPWEPVQIHYLVAGLAVPLLAAVVSVSVGAQPDPGGPMLAASVLALPLVGVGAVEIVFALALGGDLALIAGAGCFVGAAVAAVLFAGVGVSQRYAGNLPAGSFWAWKLVLPGLLVSVLLIAVSTQFAVERAPGRRLGAVIGVLFDQQASQSLWWWAGWLGVVWCAGSLVPLALMERRRQALLNARRPARRRPSRSR